MKLFNLSKYRDPTYRNLLLTCLLSMLLIGDLLTPILNYSALNLPANSKLFTDYATIASIAPGLPFLFSVVISLSVNSLQYSKVYWGCWLISSSLLVAMLFFQNNFLLLTTLVVMISFCYRALYYALDRQICTILLTSVKEFQSDIFLWGSLFGALNFKLSAYVFSNYHLQGILLIFFCGSLVLLWAARQIPAANFHPKSLAKSAAADTTANHEKTLSQMPSEPLIQRLIQLYCSLRQNPALLKFIVQWFLLLFCGGAGSLILMSKLHQQQLGITLYSNLMAVSMLIGLFSALTARLRQLRHLSNFHILRYCLLLSGGCYYLMISNNHWLFASGFLLLSFINNITLIFLSSHFFEQIGKREELVAFAPLLNGSLGSIFYGGNVLSQLLVNLLLKHQISTSLLYLLSGCAYCILALSFTKRPAQHQPEAQKF